MTHELTENQLMNGGMGIDEAHEIALTTHPTFANYHPDVVKALPQEFSTGAKMYAGLIDESDR